MRIAVDARELEGRPTGAGRILLETLRRAPEGFSEKNELFLYFKKNVPLGLPENISARKTVLKPGFLARFDLFWEQILLPGYLKKDRIDIFWGANGACSVRNPSKARRIISVYDLTFLMEPGWYGLKEKLVRRFRFFTSLWSADTVLTVSEHSAGDIRKYMGTRKPVHVVYAGSDSFTGAADRSLVKNTREKLLYAGSILNRRPVENLILALVELSKKYPRLKMDIVGENRTHPRKDLEGLVKKMDLQDRVRLLGYMREEDLAGQYESADVFCFPSYYEGFGIPLVEAQSRGLPVVTLKNSSLAEIGADSVCYSESARPEDLASAVERLLGDEALYKDFQEKGFRNARRFSWAQTSAGIWKRILS